MKHLTLVVLCGLLTVCGWSDDRGITVQAAQQAGLNDYDPERFHALLIGINEYEEWTDLRSARPDAEAMAEVLIQEFGYKPEHVRLLKDGEATRRGILQALDDYRALDEHDSLLIYYAGHGWMDEDQNGFWVPTEAPLDGKFDYISNARIVNEYFKKYDVRHLLVMADSCFAGAMLRAGEYRREQSWKLPSGYRKPSRWILTSGDLAPVEDDAGGGHSPFATRVMQFLKHSDDPAFGVNDLYVYVRKNLGSEAIFQPLRTANHMPGGEYVFARINRQQQAPAPQIPTVPEATEPDDTDVVSPTPEPKIVEKEPAPQKPEAEPKEEPNVIEKEPAAETVAAIEPKPVQIPDVVFVDPIGEPPRFDHPHVVPGLGLSLAPIRSGTYTRGSNKGEPDEQPAHTVRMTRQYWMGVHEVTNEQFLEFLNSADRDYLVEAGNPEFSLTRQGDRFVLKDPKSAREPVTGIDWQAAMAFAGWLTQREASAGRLPDNYVYRLPTEAEWEFACRGGTSTPFSFGYGHGLERYAWFSANAGHRPHEVGQKLANPWGLFDMNGNVWEWCYDWYGEYPDRIMNDPVGAASGRFRVVRGGSFAEDSTYQRSANRGRAKPTHTRNSIGIRVALAPKL